MAIVRIKTGLKPGYRPAPTLVGRLVLLAIIAIGVLSRAVGVGRYPHLIYDEYYYVPASDVLLGRRPPVAVPHAISGIDPNLLSHPPLAKELIALSILIFGNHPYAWRMPGVVLGSFVPLLVYVLAKKIFNRQDVALLASFLSACDGLMISISRVALPDSVAFPLVVLNVFLLWNLGAKWKRGEPVSLWSMIGFGVSLGLGLSAKWIGAQTILAAWVWTLIHVKQIWQRSWRERIGLGLSLTLVPLTAYFLTYFYAFAHGFQESWLPSNVFLAFFRLQFLIFKDMWSLTFFHPWSSNAWDWLLLPRPTAFLIITKPSSMIRLFSVSNPLLIWIGCLALLTSLGVAWFNPAVRYRFAYLWVLFAAYYGTWLLTPRSKFTYYFASAMIPVILAASQGLVLLVSQQGRALRATGIIGLLGIFLVSGLMFPLWTGLATPRPFYQTLFWPPSWNAKTRPLKSPIGSVTYHLTPEALAPWSLSAVVPGPGRTLPARWTGFGGPDRNGAYRVPQSAVSGYRLQFLGGIPDQPSVHGQTLYLGTTGDQVDAVRWATGQIVWSVAVPNQVMTTPLILGHEVVVGLGNQAFRSYTRRSGWIRGQGTNGLMAFNRQTGHELWYHATRGEDMATPVESHGILYEVTGSGHLIAVSANTGRLVWSLPLGGFDSMSNPVLVRGILYVATNVYRQAYPAARSTVYAVNVGTRQVLWAQNIPVRSGLSDDTVALSGSLLYVAGVPQILSRGSMSVVGNALFALSASTGRIQWQVGLGQGRMPLNQPEVGTPVARHGVVYIGSPAARTLTAVSQGHVLWTTRFSSGIAAAPLVVGPDLLVATRQGLLALVSRSTGRILTGYPGLVGPVGLAQPLWLSRTLIAASLNGQLSVISIH